MPWTDLKFVSSQWGGNWFHEPSGFDFNAERALTIPNERLDQSYTFKSSFKTWNIPSDLFFFLKRWTKNLFIYVYFPISLSRHLERLDLSAFKLKNAMEIFAGQPDESNWINAILTSWHKKSIISILLPIWNYCLRITGKSSCLISNSCFEINMLTAVELLVRYSWKLYGNHSLNYITI